MNKDTKKKLDEAMQKEFNNSSDSIENYGIPADAVRIGREIVKLSDELITVMAGYNFSENSKNLVGKDYETIKFTLVNDSLIKTVEAVRELNICLEMTKADIDEVARMKGISVKVLEGLVMLSSLKDTFGDK